MAGEEALPTVAKTRALDCAESIERQGVTWKWVALCILSVGLWFPLVNSAAAEKRIALPVVFAVTCCLYEQLSLSESSIFGSQYL